MFTVEPQPRPREVFRFLDLPAEVRNTVYKHLLLGPQAILRINKITKAQPKQMFLKGSGIQTQLLRVNKQLNQEASHFLFGMNMLQFDNTKTAFDFIWTVMGPQRVQGHWGKKTRLPAVTLPIRNLAITDRWIHGSGLRLARLMRCAPHLQALTLSQKVVGTYFDQPEGILYQLTWPSWRSTAQNLDFLIGLLRVKDFNPLTGTLFSCQPERLQADLDNTIADALLLAGVRF
ncbi:hypothetical protein ANO11243_046790 [Dothideomycetidae sp. 11243]|nr:hypothetical protein ANO11243_046790 [fungal sp. No.11243]